MNEKAFLIKSFCVSVQSRLECFLLCKTLSGMQYTEILHLFSALRSFVKKHKTVQVSK